MIKVGVKIKPREEVLDSSGRAILSLLKSRKLPVSACLSGKYIELHINETDEKRALSIAEKTVNDILHNSLIETFEMEIVKTTST